LHTIFALDHLWWIRTWLENDDASCRERFRPAVAERKENLARDVTQVVAKWDKALEQK
jgi:hypothetical protein